MNKYLSAILITGICVFSYFVFATSTRAQNTGQPSETEITQQVPTREYKQETLEGRVMEISEEKLITPVGSTSSQLYQKLEIFITKGSLKNKKITVENGNLPISNVNKYRVGDNLVITYGKDFQGKDSFYISDYVRRHALAWLFVIFVVMVVAVGRWQGVTSLIGMVVSFFVIFKFILPEISAGHDPVQVAILGSLLIIPATFFLSHGVNKKTGIAVAGTLIALIITGFLAYAFVTVTKLTGFASEEANFLQAFNPGHINIRGLLLAGIIIGVLGVLDDITISQSAIIQQLKTANPELKTGELYSKAMIIGRDHIASMVNTLILVYTGAALPLLIIFIDNPQPFAEIINHEVIADEIVRTLVGSIGLILAVPITTALASLLVGTEGK